MEHAEPQERLVNDARRLLWEWQTFREEYRDLRAKGCYLPIPFYEDTREGCSGDDWK